MEGWRREMVKKIKGKDRRKIANGESGVRRVSQKFCHAYVFVC